MTETGYRIELLGAGEYNINFTFSDNVKKVLKLMLKVKWT